MKIGPDIAPIASLIGDPARANMLCALMSGVALTAGELARAAQVTLPTASSHLGKLTAGGLVLVEKQGRHRYFRLSGHDVARLLEELDGLAARTGHLRTRTGPREPALRHARVCYDHLAGDMGVAMLDGMLVRGFVREVDGGLEAGPKLERLTDAIGLDVTVMGKSRRPICKSCLDWSVRRHHLAGALGAAVLDRLLALRWAKREAGSRVIHFSAQGERSFKEVFFTSGLGEL